MAELDEDLGAREGHSPRLKAGAVQIDFMQQLGDEVAGLRAEHGDRMAGGAMSTIHDQLVARMRYAAAHGFQQRREVHRHARGAELRGQRTHDRGLAIFVAERVRIGVGRGGHRERIRIEAGGNLLVVEGGFDADLRTGVVLASQVAPDLRPLFLAVSINQ